MTAPAPPRSGLAVLDQLIVEALDALRAARIAAAQTGSAQDQQRESRAEKHLDDLLDQRHAARP